MSRDKNTISTNWIFTEPKVLTYHVALSLFAELCNNLSCINVDNIQILIFYTCCEFRWYCIYNTGDLSRHDIWIDILLSYNQWSQVSWSCFVGFNYNSAVQWTGCNKNSLINILWSFFNHNSIRLKSSINVASSSKITHCSASCLSLIIQTELWVNHFKITIVNYFLA